VTPSSSSTSRGAVRCGALLNGRPGPGVRAVRGRAHARAEPTRGSDQMNRFFRRMQQGSSQVHAGGKRYGALGSGLHSARRPPPAKEREDVRCRHHPSASRRQAGEHGTPRERRAVALLDPRGRRHARRRLNPGRRRSGSGANAHLHRPKNAHPATFSGSMSRAQPRSPAVPAAGPPTIRLSQALAPPQQAIGVSRFSAKASLWIAAWPIHHVRVVRSRPWPWSSGCAHSP
jgi:hypothetical protein